MKIKKRIWEPVIAVFAIFLFLFIIPGKSHAQNQMPTSTEVTKLQNLPGNIHVGPLKIHPGLSVTEAYTNNIFQESGDKEGALINTTSPGMVLQLPLQRHFLQLDYHADIIEASRFHRQYNTVNQFTNAILNLDFNRLNILGGDNWQYNSTPPQNEIDIRKKYIENRAFVDVSYRLANRYKVAGFYKNTYRKFNETFSPFDPLVNPKWDNFMENDMGVDLFYRFLPKTSVLFEYGFTHYKAYDRGLSDTDRNFDSQRYWLGFMWAPTAKIIGTIKGGWYEREYASGSTSKDWSGFAMEGDLTYNLTSYDAFSLVGFRKPLETSVTTSHVPGFAPGIYGTYYISSGGTFAYSHRFTYKITGRAEVSYFNNFYRERGLLGYRRKDDRVTAGPSVIYRIQDWLTCKLGYQYGDNASNAPLESYQESLFYGTFSLTF